MSAACEKVSSHFAPLISFSTFVQVIVGGRKILQDYAEHIGSAGAIVRCWTILKLVVSSPKDVRVRRIAILRG